MKGRYQRRTLAASRHVARAEITHGGDAGLFGNHRRVADLVSEAGLRPWTMADGLAVAADGPNVFWLQPAFV